MHSTAAVSRRVQSSVSKQFGVFVADLGLEIERERHLESSHSDLVLQKHVDGLIIMMFCLVTLFLIGSIGVIAFVVRY